MSESEPRRQEYEAIRGHFLSALQSTYEQYDRAVLTLSTGLLGVSVAFIKPDSGAPGIQFRCLLLLSWVFLLLAIFSTLVSFLLSQQALRRALDDAHQFYIQKRTEALQENPWSQATQIVNVLSGCFFLLGAILTVLFVALQGG